MQLFHYLNTLWSSQHVRITVLCMSLFVSCLNSQVGMVDTRWYKDRDESPSIGMCMSVSGYVLNINWFWFWLSDVSHVGSRL